MIGLAPPPAAPAGPEIPLASLAAPLLDTKARYVIMSSSKPYRPEKIFLSHEAESCPGTRLVLERLPDVPVTRIDDPDPLVRPPAPPAETLTAGKKSLLLVRHHGRFFKPCPGRQARQGTTNVCCGYYVINFATNCPLECTYCFLQGYLTNPYVTVFANLDDLLADVQTALRELDNRPLRVGTGELTDSLALDHLIDYARPLVELFARQSHAVLELKTKTDAIDHLLGLDHRGRTVLAWSLNAPEIQQREELKTASLGARLRAARRAVDAGYPVAFHFDPLVWFAGWREAYAGVIEQLFDSVPSSATAWISLGALRVPPGQPEIMRRRFPKSPLPYGEFVTAPDGKLRYFKPLRIELYGAVLSELRRRAPEVKVYLCMERPDVHPHLNGIPAYRDEVLGEWLARDLPVLQPASRQDLPPSGRSQSAG